MLVLSLGNLYVSHIVVTHRLIKERLPKYTRRQK
jgi:hypothetical protein